jgi:hypothetical protein
MKGCNQVLETLRLSICSYLVALFLGETESKPRQMVALLKPDHALEFIWRFDRPIR